MKNVGVIFGSTTGTCEELAGKIAAKIGGEVINVTDVTKEQIESFDVLLLGSSTWGVGELQDDWYDGVKLLKESNLAGKMVSFFGCGDVMSFGDTFCDAMGIIYDEIADSGCTFVGQMPTDGYNYDASAAEKDGVLVGVALDDMNEGNKTSERIAAWIDILNSQI